MQIPGQWLLSPVLELNAEAFGLGNSVESVMGAIQAFNVSGAQNLGMVLIISHGDQSPIVQRDLHLDAQLKEFFPNMNMMVAVGPENVKQVYPKQKRSNFLFLPDNFANKKATFLETPVKLGPIFLAPQTSRQLH